MPLASRLVGLESKPYVSELDDRWAMNFAASIDDVNPVLFDTRVEALPVHPMYLAHPEWEATKLLMSDLELTPAEAGTSVEMSHDSVLRRTLTSGMTLSTIAKVVGVQRHRAGALITFELVTSEDAGDEIGVTTVRALYRGVDVDGDDRPAPDSSMDTFELPSDFSRTEMPIPATACHTYSECARIWNAFHTDIKVAEAAGISGLILHGTATLAKATSVLCLQTPDMQIDHITRISADLRAMVFAPSTAHLEFSTPRENGDSTSTVAFRLLTDDGGQALTRGAITYTPSNSEELSKEGSR